MSVETPARMSTDSPRDGRALAPVAETPAESIPGLFERARREQELWAALPISERGARLKAAHQAFLAAAEELSALLEAENGKPRGEIVTAELVADSDLFRFWLDAGPKWLRPQAVALSLVNFPGKKAAIYREPRGVVGLISSWNYPVALPLRVLAPALLAGNAVVFKPSEWAPRVGARLFQIFEKTLPAGVVTLDVPPFPPHPASASAAAMSDPNRVSRSFMQQQRCTSGTRSLGGNRPQEC